MRTNPKMRWLRQFARGLGLGASGTFLFAAIVSGMSSTPMPPPLLILLMLAIASVLLAFRWEGIGGMGAITASVGLGIFVYANAGHNQLVAASVYSAPFLFSGILFVICSRLGAQGTQV